MVVPLSIIGLPAVRCMNGMFGRLPSACRGPMYPASEVLAKSAAAGVIPRSQVLNDVVAPSMLLLLFGNPMLLRMTWTFDPVRVIVPVTLPEESKLLASMLY